MDRLAAIEPAVPMRSTLFRLGPAEQCQIDDAGSNRDAWAVDYLLDGLGAKEFERLSQSLMMKAIGPRVTSFGSGPDGGREATWEGPSQALGVLEAWNGYGVLQAKFREFPSDPKSNLDWMKKVTAAELDEWARPGSTRTRKPDYLVFTTNVRLSAVPDAGKDAIKKHLAELIVKLKLPITDFRVLDYDDICRALDDASDIRRRFQAFITPGDILAELLDDSQRYDRSLRRTLRASTARLLIEESYLGLTQAGAVGDKRVTIADVFIDLPFAPRGAWEDARDGNDDSIDAWSDAEDQIDATDLKVSERGIAAFIIAELNRVRDVRMDAPGPRHTVLVGGPGQGKSTVTQWLSQLYRSEFLRDSSVAGNPDVRQMLDCVSRRSTDIGMPSIAARRWPFRIVLTEFADYLAMHDGKSLLHYISSRVASGGATVLEPEALLHWLEAYPWVLFIDGLDEVPQSSNREQVIAAIQHFFVECDAVGGDVVAVATTRPQGYSDEFPVRTYRHFELSALDRGTALGYARGLLDARFGGALNLVEKVMGRLEKASEEKATARLFSSPLQVTILTVLLEKIGKAPGDRWRLFSEYYNVISSREQEKSGELSELLQRYESDIDAIHQQVGYLLQHRSAAAGETSASISRLEFDEIVRNQFEGQGHNESEIDALLSDFTRLVTDRLVFLTYGSADRLGFELRSLQEFMAGEFILSHPEMTIPDLLHGIVMDAHWRNVLLFAVGNIFAKRPHLRAEVVLLCQQFNRESMIRYSVLVGSDLAADIMADGSCLSMPKYARELSEIAAQGIDGYGRSRLKKLSILSDQFSRGALRDKATSLAPAPRLTWLNRAIVLSLGQQLLEEPGVFNALISSLPADVYPDLFLYAWQAGDLVVARACSDLLEFCAPERLIEEPSLRGGRLSKLQAEEAPDWLRHLATIAGRSPRWAGEVPADNAVLSAEYSVLANDREAWSWIATSTPETESWAPLQAMAAFALDPSAVQLAETLELLASRDRPLRRFPNELPWVLAGCLRFAVYEATSNEAHLDAEIWERALLNLAARARCGDLGDIDIWLAAEQRTPPSYKVDAARVDAWLDAMSDERAPLSSDALNHGVPPSSLGFRLLSVRDDNRLSSVLEVVDAIVGRPVVRKGGFDVSCINSLCEFVISQGLGDSGQEIAPEAKARYLSWLVENGDTRRSTPHRWVGWLAHLDLKVEGDVAEIVDRVGRSVRPLGLLPDDALLSQLRLIYERSPQMWGVFRLMAYIAPSTMIELGADKLEALRALPCPPPALSNFIRVLELVLAMSADGEPGLSLSESAVRVLEEREDLFDASWLLRLSRQSDPAEAYASKVLSLASEAGPSRCEPFADLAWRDALAAEPAPLLPLRQA